MTERIAGMRKWRTQRFQMTVWIIKNSQNWVKGPDGEAMPRRLPSFSIRRCQMRMWDMYAKR